MTTKGHCEEETLNNLMEFGKSIIDLKNLERAIRSDHSLLTKILIEHAKRIDKQERRLILLEDRVYKGIGKGPCD